MLQAKVDGIRKIVFEEVDEPEIQEDEALIDIKSVGICGSDVNIYLGNSSFLKFPQVQGHEFGGIINLIKDESKDFKAGMKVVINPVKYCGHCYYCLNKLEYLCDNRSVIGDENTPGAMKEKISVPIKNLVHLNSDFDLTKAPMIEPTAVALHAVNNINNSNILVIGLGTIGLLVQQLAKNNRVITLDIKDELIALSRDLGSNLALSFKDPNLKQKIFNFLNNDKIDLLIDTVTSFETMNFSLDLIKKRGKIIFIGLPHHNFEFDFLNALIKDVTISPSFLYTPEEFKGAASMIENNLINVEKLITKMFPLNEADKAYSYKVNTPSVKIILINN